jgi:hypothetical protein
MVREKKKWSSIFDIINSSCNFQQNRSKEVVMDITEVGFLTHFHKQILNSVKLTLSMRGTTISCYEV